MSFTSKNTKQITKRAEIVCETITTQTIQNIIGLMESTRIKLDLSITSFAALLSIPSPSYYRMIGGQTLNSLILLRFCAIFGYDLESVVSGPIPTASDMQAVEMASWMGSLPDSALQDIQRVVEANPDVSKINKRLFGEALSEFRQRRNEYVEQLTDDVSSQKQK